MILFDVFADVDNHAIVLKLTIEIQTAYIRNHKLEHYRDIAGSQACGGEILIFAIRYLRIHEIHVENLFNFLEDRIAVIASVVAPAHVLDVHALAEVQTIVPRSFCQTGSRHHACKKHNGQHKNKPFFHVPVPPS